MPPAPDAGLGISAAWHGPGGHRDRRHHRSSCSADDGLAEAFGVPSRAGPSRRSASPRTRGPAPAAGSPPRSAATTTGRTRWPMSWRARSPPGSSTWPTGGSSPWTGGSGSPRTALTWPGGSRTARNPSRSRPLRPCPTGRNWCCCANQASMLGKRRREHGDKTLPRLPDTVARLVSFTVTTRTARRAKTSVIKVLTTLLGSRRSSRPARSPPSTRSGGRSRSRSCT